MHGVVAQGIEVSLSKRLILRQVACEIPTGSLTAVIGCNGSGKTTFLKTVASLITPTNGTIKINGSLLVEMPPAELARTISWVPQQTQIAFPYRVEEIVMMGRYPWHKGFPGHEDKKKVFEALAHLSLTALRQEPFQKLSFGQQHKVLIARALANNSPVLILDEPCANLDLSASIAFLKMLKDLTASGTTILVAMHDLNQVLRYFSHCLVFKEGEIIAEGAPKEMLTESLITEAFGVQGRLTAVGPDVIFI